MIVGEAGDSVDLPGPLSERVADLAADFVKIKPAPDHLKNLHNLQIRFLNAIVLHSFGLQTNWFNEDNSVSVSISFPMCGKNHFSNNTFF